MKNKRMRRFGDILCGVVAATAAGLLGVAAIPHVTDISESAGVPESVFTASTSQADPVSTAANDVTETPNGAKYYADGFTLDNLDEKGWSQLAGSNVAETRTTAHNGELQIDHRGSATSSNYWGGAYAIADGNTYTDFTFEMNFRVIDWLNEARFFSIMFHTQKVGSRNVGYMVNYRMNGQSAASCLNNEPRYKDLYAVTGNPVLTDKGLHTLKIECEGSTVTSYMDGRFISTWDFIESYTESNALFAEPLTSGGFALTIANNMLSVASVSILPYVGEQAEEPPIETIEDDIIVNAYYENTGLINGPTVVCDVTDAEILRKVVADDVRPSNVILRYDEDGDVVDTNGDVLGTFEDIYGAIRGNIIPIVRVESSAAAERFIEYSTDTRKITDISVMSTDPALVKTVRQALPYVRGMIYYDGATSIDGIVATTHGNLASVAVLDQNLCSLKNVTYLQARFETVWIMANSTLTVDIYDCVTSGAYGIIARDYRDVYCVLSDFTEKTLPRTAFNIAHRGVTAGAYENSLHAVELAIAGGATHLELDAKLTLDGAVMIMHDDSIAATTTGTGNLESMTYAQVRAHNMTVRDAAGATNVYLKDENGDNIIEKVPTLQEVFELIKDTDIILVLEIKTEKTAIVSQIKRIVDEYGVKDNLVFITFNENILTEVARVMPDIPAAFLEGLGSYIWSIDDFGDIMTKLGTLNAVLDKNYVSSVNAQFDRYMRDRGVASWYWTFATEDVAMAGEQAGFAGLTNNCAETFADKAATVIGISRADSTPSIGGTVKVTVTTYGGANTECDGEAVYCRRTKGGYTVIARYLTDRGYIYTQSFTVTVA